MATEVIKNQTEDTVGSSLAALETEKDPQGRRIEILLVKAGAGGGGEWGEATARGVGGEGEGEREGGGVEH